MHEAVAAFDARLRVELQSRMAWSLDYWDWRLGQEAGAFIHVGLGPNGPYYVLGNTFWGFHEFVGSGLIEESGPAAIIRNGPIVGMVHTHPNCCSQTCHNNNVFSPADRLLGDIFGITVFAITPDFDIIIHNPSRSIGIR